MEFENLNKILKCDEKDVEKILNEIGSDSVYGLREAVLQQTIYCTKRIDIITLWLQAQVMNKKDDDKNKNEKDDKDENDDAEEQIFEMYDGPTDFVPGRPLNHLDNPNSFGAPFM